MLYFSNPCSGDEFKASFVQLNRRSCWSCEKFVIFCIFLNRLRFVFATVPSCSDLFIYWWTVMSGEENVFNPLKSL